MNHPKTAAFNDPWPSRRVSGLDGQIPSTRQRRNGTPLPAVNAWPATFSSILVALQQLATSTEHDFLRIGSQMQGIYQRSTALAETAHQLVEVASGEGIHKLTDRLRQILGEMESYFEKAQQQNVNSCTALGKVAQLLQQVAEPLAGFKKMSMQLYILEVSVKIESVSLGEMEGEFLNLAQDIKKLSRQIKEKANVGHDHRLLLSSIISQSIAAIQAAKTNQESSVRGIVGDTRTSLLQLEAVNDRVSTLGIDIRSVSAENSNNISDIVQSMQFHDIFRQQIEHVMEALQALSPTAEEIADEKSIENDSLRLKLIGNTGDICELQEAQLQFAATEFHAAVSSIVTHLREIGTIQKQMERNIASRMGGINTSNTSFIDDVGHHMSSVTTLLTTCADTNKELAKTTKKVTGAVEEISSFVADIEEIGHEITQIALNSRIKAAGTGDNGASLSALSEEVGQLANEAVRRADSIIGSLTKIQSATDTLSTETDTNEKILDSALSGMTRELGETLTFFARLGQELFALLPQLRLEVHGLSGEIEQLISGIDVHERAKFLAEQVLTDLRRVVHQARQLHPASADFKKDLRRMAEHYTMESERRIHEAIAKKHGMGGAVPETQTKADASGQESEFGDNVELF
jgi:hypothetical protein